MKKSTSTTTYPVTRIAAVDVVRGLAMILMALDHTRDFLGVNANPVDLATTTAPLFFTRWITHFCAPTFFLLTGTSAWLSGQGKPASQLSWRLLTRGAWLPSATAEPAPAVFLQHQQILCSWYARIRQSRRHPLLSYL